MKTLKFFKCRICGNVVAKLVDKEVPVFCCGEKMEELSANTTEAAVEKHLPVVTVKNGVASVQIGSTPHPMEQSHFINFIAVQTQTNCTIVCLSPETAPEAQVFVGKSKVVAVYEYCNLHGLWKTEL